MSSLQASAPVSLANWRIAPFSRWAFQHVDELIACASISRAADDSWVLPIDSLRLERFSLPITGGASMNLLQFLRATNTDGLVVLCDGRIAYEFYDHDMTIDSRHILMSATKSIVGLIAGILHEKHMLDLDAPVSGVLPELAASAYHDATLRQLLDMRAGVMFGDAELRAYGLATNWKPASTGEEQGGLHAFFERAPGAAPHGHGGAFRYVSANTDLLGWAIERATGQSFAALTSEFLWIPLGAQADAYITVDSDGAARCAAGLCATVRDLARIGQLLLQNGKRGPRQIIPEAWLFDMANEGDRQAWQEGDFAAGFAGMNMNYRGGWYVVEDAPKTLSAMGIHGQNLFIDATNRIVIAKLSSQESPIDHRAIALTLRAVPELRRCLTGT